MKTLAFAVLLLIDSSICTTISHAQITVSSTVTPGAGGYRYDYTITNVGTAPIWSFSIDTGDAPSITTAPNGWGVQILAGSSRRTIQWVSLSESADLQPSSALAGFSATSTRSPGTVSYDAIDEIPNIYDEQETTGPAFLPSQLANIATRLQVGTGENALIGGFIITGTEEKEVIVRGIGSSLPLSGTLADPVIEVHGSSGELLATNDNWRDATTSQQIIDSLPPTNDLESALWGTINPGAYTVVLRGKNDATGIGLFEVYDLDRTADSKLANISTRGFVNTGDNVMIGGTIIVGTAPATVVVRAIGPSLANFGVSNALRDPMLELYDGNGALLESNDNWRTAHEAEIAAAGLAPTDDRESAILRTLAPGAYTAIVRGSGSSTGVAVVEAYQLQ